MVDHSTVVTTEFSSIAPDPADINLILEQEPYGVDSGQILSMEEIAAAHGLQFVHAVGGKLITDEFDQISSLYYAQCGANSDGSITAVINVLKSPDSLQYNLVASRGTFGQPVTQSITKEESLNFQLKSSVDVGYIVKSIVSIAWEGDVFDAAGGVVNIPVPELSGNYLVANQPVYGTVRVKYTVFGDTWSLNIPKRDDTDSDPYSSTVFAFYGDNQVETLNVFGPSLTGGCDQTVTVCFDDDCEQPPDDEPIDDGDGDGSSVALQLNAYDYCHGGHIAGATFWIGGKEVPATGHTVKRGITYSITVKASGYKDFTNSFSV